VRRPRRSWFGTPPILVRHRSDARAAPAQRDARHIYRVVAQPAAALGATHRTPITQLSGARHYDGRRSRPPPTKMPTERGNLGALRRVQLACALLCATFAGTAFATPPLSVQRYSLEEGLSQQTVNAIVQDHDGFMWFGTEDGLNRFDGYEFRQFRHERGVAQTLPSGWINSLVASEDGLWIGTSGS